MRHIVCEECRRPYDFDKDDFCPRCGAFNQPVKTWGTDAQGNIVRVDGLNEQNHAKSFVHSEVHREKAIRKATGLDRNGRKPAPPRPPVRTAQRKQPSGRPSGRSRLADSALLQILLWMAGMVIFVSVILPFLFALW